MPIDPWPFDQPSNVACITTRKVLRENIPILLVTHYDDDASWAFLCGTTNDEKDRRAIAMREAMDLDQTLVAIADLPPGFTATRERVDGLWGRARSNF